MASRALDDYTVAWICALPLEAAAARVMLDKTHTQPQHIGDANAYQFGELNGHNIVIAHLPNGIYGTVSAASFGLMVGIGGGVPSRSNNIQLGNVVVSKPGGKHVQGGQFECTGMKDVISEIIRQHADLLYKSSYCHADGAPDCAECNKKQMLYIYYGLIVSGDQVIKDSETQDCLKQWQGYAVLTAAVYTKSLLHQDKITELEELFVLQDRLRRVAVTSLGGIGKIQVLYTSRAVIKQTYLKLAQILGLQDVKTAEVKEQVKLYLSTECAGKWLLIFDNADDTDMWLATSDIAPALEDFIPETLFNLVPIPEIDKDTVFQILQQALACKNLLQDNIAAGSFLEHLAFLPLAIMQASAYIIKNNAVELLTDYLSFMACINPQNIPQQLLPSQLSKKQRIDALGLLSAYLFTNSQDAGINMHRLRVADQIQEVFPDNNYTNQGIWREYLPHALAVVHEDEFGIKEGHHQELIQNIADCLASNGRYYEAELLYTELLEWNQEKDGHEHTDTLTRMANLASTYRNQGRWNEAEKLGVQVMDTRKRHPDTLTSMANLASTYWNQGRWDEAEKLGVQVMDTRKTVLGPEHPDTLISMNNLAYTWHSQQKIQDALALMGECLILRKRVLGSSHPHSISSSCSLQDWKEQADKHPQGPGQEESIHLAEESQDGYLPAIAITKPSADDKNNTLHNRHARSATPIKRFLEDHPLLIASRSSSPVLGGHDLQDID
ncbi:hypothetical protein BDW62DRAFT_209875 [Aspergillus aurantiobrunneus]